MFQGIFLAASQIPLVEHFFHLVQTRMGKHYLPIPKENANRERISGILTAVAQ